MKNIIKRIGSMILAFTICFSTHGPIEVYADTPEEWNYSYEDIGNSYETWVCPENGIYKFEVWGASGGGCYTVRKTRTISYTVTCGCSSCWCEGFNGISDNWNCTKCGHGHMGPHGDGMGTGNGTCTASKTKYSTVVYYELGCGKTEGLRYVSDGIEKYIIKGSVSDTGKERTKL